MFLKFLTQEFNSLLPLLFPCLIWAVLLFFFLALLLAVRDGLQRLKRLHQIPCHRCQYYTGSLYLKCPVHPYAAFSEEAIHCCDYELAAVRVRPEKPRRLSRSKLIHLRRQMIFGDLQDISGTPR